MKHFIICDIQPEYEECFCFQTKMFTDYLNRSVKNYGKVTYFYNGYDTLGMIKEFDLIEWLIVNGLSEKVLPHIEFIDKGYGFLRCPIDNEVPHESITSVLKHMIDNDLIFDDLDECYRDLVNDEYIYYNDCIPVIKDSHLEIVFTGGSVKACLLELELVAKSFDKPYVMFNKFTY